MQDVLPMNHQTSSRQPRTAVDAPRAPDLRPSSPAQLAWVGFGLLLAGAVLPLGAVPLLLGLVCLAVAALGALARPRVQVMYWRGRRIELDDAPGRLDSFCRHVFRG